MADALTRSTIRKLDNAEAFPLIALQAVRDVRTELDELEGAAILRARELGASLEDIADAMGITRQGVSYRLKQLSGNGNGPASDDDVIDLAAEETREPK